MPPTNRPRITPTQQASANLVTDGASSADVAKRLSIAPRDVLLWKLFNPSFRKLAECKVTSPAPAPAPEPAPEPEVAAEPALETAPEPRLPPTDAAAASQPE